jgi:hypothetical protein
MEKATRIKRIANPRIWANVSFWIQRLNQFAMVAEA